MLRYLTAGEAHGPALLAVMDGFPAGVHVDRANIARSLERRRAAPGRSPRRAGETDKFEITGGLYKNKTTGAPIGVLIENSRRIASLDESSAPRPGHADLAGMLKYSVTSSALIRERASARETAARTALGAFCLRLLELLDVRITGRVIQLGGVKGGDREMLRELGRAESAGRSIGGIFEISAENLPAGLGSHTQWDMRLSSRLAAQIMGLNAVKGVEFGAGFAFAGMKGEESVDAFKPGRRFKRTTNLAGGLEGGMTTGETLILRAVVRPVPGQRLLRSSIDMKTGKPAKADPGSPDVTAVFAASVIAEHLAAFELTDAVLRKFGGDSLSEIKPRVDEWRARTAKILSGP